MHASSTPSRLAAAAVVTVLAASGIALAGPASAVPTTSNAPTATAAASTVATTTAMPSAKATVGKPLTLIATVSPAPSGGTVSFASGGAYLSGCTAVSVSSSTGRAYCRTKFTAAGSYLVRVRYSGVSSTWAASSGSAMVTAAKASPVGTFVGSLGSCTTTKGALVAVDFKTWTGPIVRGCDPKPTTGITLLTTAGFTTAGDQHDGPTFICRIGHPLFASGTQYPTPATDKCAVTPPATAYWSYWLAATGKNTWTYSPLGAYSDVPKNGEVEAWTFGGTDIAGTKGQPTFTPNQVRAGLPAGTLAAQPATRKVTAATPARANLDTATQYLVAQLVDGTHYEPFGGGFGDFGLTMDGAFALAASGRNDTALRKIVTFLDDRGKDGSGRTIDDYTGIGTQYASGGSIGKEALVAEVAGYNPRDFSGHNLIKALDRLVCTEATKAPDYSCAGNGSFAYASSTFSQALGVLAQLRAGDTVGAKAPIAFLEGLQHKSGAFPSVIPGADSETDSTGMAAMALALVPGSKSRTAVAKALSWLARQQSSDGGFPGASGDSVNSAAIASQALRLDAGTYTSQISSAQRFLASEQNSDGGFNVAVGAESNGSDVRASTQATGAVVGTPFGSLIDDLSAKSAAAAGGNYLVSQLVDGTHYNFPNSTFENQGLTADALFALLATRGHSAAVARILAHLKTQVDAYADTSGAFGGPYSGSLAKLSLVAEATGGDPHSFAGTDLLKILVDHVCTKATTDGTCTAPGEFVSSFATVSQALGVLALQASPVASDRLTVRSPEVVRLHQLQCADGGFSSQLIAPGAKCSSEVDTTGYAVQALAAVRGTDNWLGAAQVYLQSKQRTSGLFPGAAGDNSNSTALAAQALQTLTTALTSPTAAQPNARTVSPIVTLQSALTGLDGLAVASGGFGITSNATADIIASTQSVAAAAQVSLLHESGAIIRSLPRIAITTTSGGGSATSPPSTAPGTSSAGGAGSGEQPNGSGDSGLANTGVAAMAQLKWAALLLLAGAALLIAGRRPVVTAIGRHR